MRELSSRHKTMTGIHLVLPWYCFVVQVVESFRLHGGGAFHPASKQLSSSTVPLIRGLTVSANLLGNERGKVSGLGLDDQTRAELKTLVESHQVLLFMKGTPAAPRCGYSEQVVRMLQAAGLDDFSFVNVLNPENAQVRQDIKLYSDWATIPQLYIEGEFIGGCELIREMFNEGTLQTMVKPGSQKGVTQNETQITTS